MGEKIFVGINVGEVFEVLVIDKDKFKIIVQVCKYVTEIIYLFKVGFFFRGKQCNIVCFKVDFYKLNVEYQSSFFVDFCFLERYISDV